ncbi:MAG: hypothetical protein SH818_11615 [Saprospiraceae bacterium]|nr:hypothetical protein [Saprospiraceae bacterium]
MIGEYSRWNTISGIDYLKTLSNFHGIALSNQVSRTPDKHGFFKNKHHDYNGHQVALASKPFEIVACKDLLPRIKKLRQPNLKKWK